MENADGMKVGEWRGDILRLPALPSKEEDIAKLKKQLQYAPRVFALAFLALVYTTAPTHNNAKHEMVATNADTIPDSTTVSFDK